MVLWLSSQQGRGKRRGDIVDGIKVVSGARGVFGVELSARV